MKHVLCLMFVIALCSGSYAVNSRIALGMDVFGEFVGHDENQVGGYDEQAAPTVSLQIMEEVKDFSLGVGANYQFPRDNKDLPGGLSSNIGTHYYIPIYGLIAYNIPTTGKVKPQLIGQIGYNITKFKFPYNDEDGRYIARNRMFYGLGFGIDSGKASLNVLYQINGSNIKYEWRINNAWEKRSDIDYQSRQLNLSIGYRIGSIK